MKHSFLVLAFFMLVSGLQAQKEKKTNTYRVFGVQYKVSKALFSDGFGSYAPKEWNEHGSSVCECAGIIHLNDDRDFRFVIYPSIPDNVESARHMQIWDYNYQAAAASATVKTQNGTFEYEVSTFSNATEYEVRRYVTKMGRYNYLIYFFAEPAVMQAHEADVTTVINSFKASKRFPLKIK